MRAVVQQNDIAAANLALGARDDFLSRLRFPVVTGDVPHTRLQPEGSHRAQRGRTAAAERRPEDLRFHPGGVKDGLSGLRKLAAQLGRRCKDQVGMAPGMAANGMTGGDQGARDLGLLLNILSNEEKCGLHAMAFQHLDHAPGVGIVGPVVVGERQQARAGPEADECRAIELRGGRHGLVAPHAGQPRNPYAANEPCNHRIGLIVTAAAFSGGKLRPTFTITTIALRRRARYSAMRNVLFPWRTFSNHPATSQSKARFESARAHCARSSRKPCTRSASPSLSVTRFCDRFTTASTGPPSRHSSLSSSRAMNNCAASTSNAIPTRPTLRITFSKKTSCLPA